MSLCDRLLDLAFTAATCNVPARSLALLWLRCTLRSCTAHEIAAGRRTAQCTLHWAHTHCALALSSDPPLSEPLNPAPLHSTNPPLPSLTACGMALARLTVRTLLYTEASVTRPLHVLMVRTQPGQYLAPEVTSAIESSPPCRPRHLSPCSAHNASDHAPGSCWSRDPATLLHSAHAPSWLMLEHAGS